jgi:TetR/AcrR family transcriptional repressor of nem operon
VRPKAKLDDWSNFIYSNLMNQKTNDTRLHILNVGYELIVNQGFTAVGLSQLLKAADVPKGSFYHYFKSKEAFGEALIEHYFDHYLTRVDSILVHGQGNHAERLLDYLSRWRDTQSGVCNAHKCLVVKLSAEVSDLSDSMRQALQKGADCVVQQMATSIENGVKEGSITSLDHQQAAKNLYSLWLGASLLSKLSQSSDTLDSAFNETKRLIALT